MPVQTLPYRCRPTSAVPPRRRSARPAAAAAITALATLILAPLPPARSAYAADYPARPVKIVVPAAPGDGNDTFARHLAAQMTTSLKQPVVVENNAGAGGTIGTERVAKAAPDGYTLLLGHTGTLAISPLLYPRLAYDPRNAFVAVGPLASSPQVLVVPAASPIMSVADLITRAKAAPGRLRYSTAGGGAGSNLGGMLLEQMAGIRMKHVPHAGSGSALSDVTEGRLDLMFSDLPSAVPQIDGGRLRAIAVTGTQRSGRLPQVPTVAESGLRGYENTLAYGLVAPRGTPQAVLQVLGDALAGTVDSPKLREAFRQEGAEPLGGSAEEFAALVAREADKWAGVIRTGATRAE